jgi:uncharacterized protein with HEPN domain
MSKEGQRLADYLGHMLQAVDRINRYTERLDEVAFLQDELVQDAVIRNLEILGEASNNILKRFPDFQAQHPALPLALAYQMRNVVAHGYFKVDFELVWKTIRGDLPSLYVQVNSVRAGLVAE